MKKFLIFKIRKEKVWELAEFLTDIKVNVKKRIKQDPIDNLPFNFL